MRYCHYGEYYGSYFVGPTKQGQTSNPKINRRKSHKNGHPRDREYRLDKTICLITKHNIAAGAASLVWLRLERLTAAANLGEFQGYVT